MNEITKSKPATDQDKQAQPMPGEIDPKNAKVEVFLAMMKAKNRLDTKK